MPRRLKGRSYAQVWRWVLCLFCCFANQTTLPALTSISADHRIRRHRTQRRPDATAPQSIDRVNDRSGVLRWGKVWRCAFFIHSNSPVLPLPEINWYLSTPAPLPRLPATLLIYQRQFSAHWHDWMKDFTHYEWTKGEGECVWCRHINLMPKT